MFNPAPGEAANRLGAVLQYWQSWLGRTAIHLPWILAAGAYVGFLNTGQGQTALEFPIDRPLASVALVGALVGLCSSFAGLTAQCYREAGWRPPIVTLRPLMRGLLKQSGVRPWQVRFLPQTRPWAGLLCYTLLGGVFSSGVLTVAQNSGAPNSAMLVFWLFVAGGSLGLYLISFVILFFGQRRARVLGRAPVDPPAWLIAGSFLCLALAIYAAAAFLVMHDLNALVALGSHALVASGALSAAFLCQGILYFVLTRATLRAGWAVVALAVVVYFLQRPLAERANPLLAKVPAVARTESQCAALTPGVATAREPTSGASDPPSILIGAEGGGIRAAYWTALSLEELSEARGGSLLANTDVISGVSGGSLGVATFLGAQDLPPDARRPCIREFLAGDFLSPLVAGLLFLDVPRLLIPIGLLDKHRGDYFEAFMARRWLALTGSDFFYRRLRDAAGPRERRAVVYFNATDALSGQYVGLMSRPNAPGQLEPSRLNRAILDRLPDLRIAQAVHMSARFPLLSPSPDLQASAMDASLALFGQARSDNGGAAEVSLASLVDGGYFDNSALWPVLRLLDNDRARNDPVDREGDRNEVFEAVSSPAVALLDRRRNGSQAPHRIVLHIVNDQMRNCAETPLNEGCIQASAGLLRERMDSRGGWLLRPTQAIQAVQSEHSLLSAVALGRTQSTIVRWKLPMPKPTTISGPIGSFLDFLQWLPIHGRDNRSGRVALAWTLAPDERSFLCREAARIRNIPGLGAPKASPEDRSKECLVDAR